MSSIPFYSTRKSKIFGKKNSKKLHTQKNGPSGALKSHNAEKLKGGPFEVYQHPFCRKTKKLKTYFREKILQCRKKLKGGGLWYFSTSILSQNIEKMQGDPLGKLFFRKKSRSAEKK